MKTSPTSSPTREGNQRPAGLRPHGLRQEGSVARLAIHRRLVVDGRQRRQGPAERPAGRRVGHPHGGRHSARLLDHAWRRRQRTGGGLCAHQVCRVAEEICPAGSAGNGLPRGRGGAGARAYRPADLLVQRLHRGALETRTAGDERGRYAEVAHGAEPAWVVLEGGHEARLSGRRLLDAPEICPAARR